MPLLFAILHARRRSRDSKILNGNCVSQRSSGEQQEGAVNDGLPMREFGFRYGEELRRDDCSLRHCDQVGEFAGGKCDAALRCRHT